MKGWWHCIMKAAMAHNGMAAKAVRADQAVRVQANQVGTSSWVVELSCVRMCERAMISRGCSLGVTQMFHSLFMRQTSGFFLTDVSFSLHATNITTCMPRLCLADLRNAGGQATGPGHLRGVPAGGAEGRGHLRQRAWWQGECSPRLPQLSPGLNISPLKGFHCMTCTTTSLCVSGLELCAARCPSSMQYKDQGLSPVHCWRGSLQLVLHLHPTDLSTAPGVLRDLWICLCSHLEQLLEERLTAADVFGCMEGLEKEDQGLYFCAAHHRSGAAAALCSSNTWEPLQCAL
eukprot:1147322-Pelagomonas_calceolata.AAC.2